MLSKCCCCVPLRAGCLVLGILGILNGIAAFFQGGEEWANITIGIFYLVAYGALVFGAITYNGIAVMVNLVCTAIIIILQIIAVIIVSASIGWVNDSDVQAVLGIAIMLYILEAVLNAYFWICSYSFYQELKEGSANPV